MKRVLCRYTSLLLFLIPIFQIAHGAEVLNYSGTAHFECDNFTTITSRETSTFDFGAMILTSQSTGTIRNLLDGSLIPFDQTCEGPFEITVNANGETVTTFPTPTVCTGTTSAGGFSFEVMTQQTICDETRTTCITTLINEFQNILDSIGGFLFSRTCSGHQVNVKTSTDTSVLNSDVIQTLNDLITMVSNLDPTDASIFRGINSQPRILSRLNSALEETEAENYALALGRLNNLLNRINGCVDASGTPDSNDWVINCAIQIQIREAVLAAIDGLNTLNQ